MDKNTTARSILLKAFPGIKESDANEMIASSTQCTYPANTILCHEGALETTFYMILDGQVRVTKVINAAEERLLKYLAAGDFFGEMAIIQNAPRAAKVETTQETTVLQIYKEDFTRFIERSSIVSLAMAREVSRRLTQNDTMAIEDLSQKARELAEAYEQLAEQEIARSEFLSTIAHELRTPLMTTNGFLQIIRMGMLQGEALNSALDSMARNLEDITTLINDILFMQEMDLILPEFQPVDTGKLAAAAVEKLYGRASLNKVRLTLASPPSVPLIMGDEKSLERAISAILDNAIKFSPDGGDVLVEVGSNGQQVYIRIQDHGVGVPPEALPRIFDRFYHLDKVGNHLFRGAGIGLSIARQVIEQHKGYIDVETETGQGSTFTTCLPLKEKIQLDRE
jgi:signal transduction histidine kinase